MPVGPRFLLPTPIGDVSAPIRTMLDRKFATVLKQRYDFSCGSASLASLLRFHYDLPVDEAQVFQGMWRNGDRAQIRKLGFSLLDMKRYLEARGLAANGFKVSLRDIQRRQVPGIALVDMKGYKHFVVIKGIAGENVLVGDPSRGLMIEPIAHFEQAWNGIYFVIDPDTRAGRFNAGAQWASVARAPTNGRFTNPVSLQALWLTAPFFGEF
ncbi:peptidase C39 [Sphingomonas ginkgonis]|uniref:Peptidase C39 n=2 Tax=Sphingomonas ginkgonis TaxID=2315330 RepID=A0A429VEE7_9SPHN|nr:peptidase C39 [Sphingomonas ginkgonis]